jgi:hypothetical protein
MVHDTILSVMKVFVGVASSHDTIAARCRSHRKKGPTLLKSNDMRDQYCPLAFSLQPKHLSNYAL